MPHIILECSDNIIEKDMKPLLADIQNILVAQLPTKLEACKSRSIRHSDFLLGNGDTNNAFVHLSIRVLQGRSEELLNQTAQIILEKMAIYFDESSKKLNLQITLALQNLPPIYLKYSK